PVEKGPVAMEEEQKKTTPVATEEEQDEGTSAVTMDEAPVRDEKEKSATVDEED
ncbi:hypothetical protein MKX03_035381, partial [Papaver bracteatum]